MRNKRKPAYTLAYLNILIDDLLRKSQFDDFSSGWNTSLYCLQDELNNELETSWEYHIEIPVSYIPAETLIPILDLTEVEA